VLGLLGTKLDGIKHDERWTMWRPSIGAVMQKTWPVDRFELLYEHRFTPLADFVINDMRTCSPHTEVRPQLISLGENPWDFESVYDGLLTFAESYPFDPDKDDYFIHITTGTHVAQICLFLLTETGRLPARLLQTGPNHRAPKDNKASGKFDIIDLDLSRYDRLATRFAREQADARDLLKSGIATKNAQFNALIGMIEQVALRSKTIELPFSRIYENTYSFGVTDYAPLLKGVPAIVTRRLDAQHPASRVFWFIRSRQDLRAGRRWKTSARHRARCDARTSIAFSAYSTWNKRPSGEKVDTPWS
jgi:hypothetical protein